jgi:radical SAM protein with 4Fe4S-binding SPASM domain
MANVVMRQSYGHSAGVKQLAMELGADFTVDPTITPMMNGDRFILDLNIDNREVRQVFRDPLLIDNPDEFCAPPSAVDEEDLDARACSAGHTFCYISPYGDVYPCVQFPLPSGNLRRQSFQEIWSYSPQLADVRSIRARDLDTCSGCVHLGGCSRCPGLAYMEGNMRGPSTQDCEKSATRTGIPSANMRKRMHTQITDLVQIGGAR